MLEKGCKETYNRKQCQNIRHKKVNRQKAKQREKELILLPRTFDVIVGKKENEQLFGETI